MGSCLLQAGALRRRVRRGGKGAKVGNAGERRVRAGAPEAVGEFGERVGYTVRVRVACSTASSMLCGRGTL